MATLPLNGQASKAFLLSFRRWCIASSSASACVSRQCHSAARARSRTSTACSGRATTAQVTSNRTFATSLAIHNGRAGFRDCIRPTGRNGRRSYSRSRALQRQEEAGSKLDSNLRHALRTLTRPCVVVTASAVGSNAWTGATLSSFDTISLNPIPQVSFNIKLPSRTYDAFSQSGDLCVHILNASPKGAMIADAFTKSYDDSSTPFGLLQKAGCTFTRGKDETAPKIYLEGAVLSRLICKKDEHSQEIDVGDHKLCTLTVTHVEQIFSSGRHGNQHALAYGQRQFRGLGKAIPPGLAVEPESAAQSKQNLDDRSIYQPDASVIPRAAHINGPDGADRQIILQAGTGARSEAAQAERPANILTFTRTRHQPVRMIRTGFHTAAVRQSTVSTRMNPAPKGYIPIEKVPPPGTPVSPEVMQQTVADFLCHSQIRPAPRTSQLRDARRLGQIALDRLRKDDNDRRLTSLERQELVDICNRNERFIARRLAHHAANDLQDMLDTNHVSQSRVRYIEKCIEAGQAALLHEAKDFAAGRPRAGFSKAHLPDKVEVFEELDTHMRTVLMRLRDLHEEEDLD